MTPVTDPDLIARLDAQVNNPNMGMVGAPQGVGQFGPGTKYTPAQMAQLDTASANLRSREAAGDPATYGAPTGPQPVTDPALIARLEAQAAPQQSAPASGLTQQQTAARMSMPLMMGGPYLPDLAFGVRQGWDAAAEGLASLFGHRQDVAPVNAQALADYKQNYGELPGSSVGRGLGQATLAAAALPMRAAGVVGTALQSAGQGAVANMMTPAYGVSDANYGAQKFDQAKQGAELGGATGLGLGAVGKVFGPTDAAAMLRSEGVTPTIGQQMGGWWKPLEEKLTSLPIVGDAIKMAQASGLDDFNRAIYNRILAPLGQAYSGPVGQKGLESVGNTLSNAYETLLPKMAPTAVDQPFLQGAQQLQGMLKSSPNAAQRFQDIYQNEVLNKITDGGTLPPSAMKDVESRLGAIGRTLTAANDSDQQLAGRAVFQLQNGLRQAVARSNPQMAPQLQAINNGYAQLVQLQNAAKTVKVARNEGVVTPSDYLRGIKSGDTSARDNVFSSGNAMNQDLAQAADKTLSSTYPDSGSVGRGMIAALAGGAFAPKVLAGAGIASLPYLPLLRNMAAGGSGLLGDAAKMAPYLGLSAPMVSGLLSNQ